MLRAGLLATIAAALGCGGASSGGGPAVYADFDCADRRMGYELTGGFGAHKTGVAATCDQSPQIVTFRQETPETERVLQTRKISSTEFDELWEKIDSTGWRHLEDCDYLSMGSDPEFVIVIGDHSAKSSIRCSPTGSGESKSLQFPHESIINELDRAARGFQ